MKSFLTLIVVMLGVLCLGCEDEATTKPKPKDPYLAPTSPENVLENLQTAYRRREPERYAELLHPGFLFWFQPNDAWDLGMEFWGLETDTLQTAQLLQASAIHDISINLTYEPAVPVHAGSDTMFIRVNPTFLELIELDESSGVTITWRVSGDIQDMLFVRGDGTDSTRWYLLDWRDISAGGSRAAVASARTSSWGKFKAMF